MDVGYKNPGQKEKLSQIYNLIQDYKTAPWSEVKEIEKEIEKISLELAIYLRNKYPNSFNFYKIDFYNTDLSLQSALRKTPNFKKDNTNYIIYEFGDKDDVHVFFHNGNEYNRENGIPPEFNKFAVELGLAPLAIRYLYGKNDIGYDFGALTRWKIDIGDKTKL